MDFLLAASSSSAPPGESAQVVKILFWVAFPFVCFAIGLTFFSIWEHIKNYHVRRLQRHVIRILFMVPVFAVTGWVGVIDPMVSRYFELVTSFYEGFVVLCFFYLLVGYLGGEGMVTRRLERRRQASPSDDPDALDLDLPEGFPSAGDTSNEAGDASSSSYRQHPSQVKPEPLCLPRVAVFARMFPSVSYDVRVFFRFLKHLILQYVVIMPLIAVIQISFDIYWLSKYPGTFDAHTVYTVLNIIRMVSVTLSLLGLLRFYNVFGPDLLPFRPLPKFLCIKAVIFLSFYQRLLFQFIEWVLPADSGMAVSGHTINSFMIAIEMAGAAILHMMYFSYSDYLHLSSRSEDRADDRLDAATTTTGGGGGDEMFVRSTGGPELRSRAAPVDSIQTTLLRGYARALLHAFSCDDVLSDIGDMLCNRQPSAGAGSGRGAGRGGMDASGVSFNPADDGNRFGIEFTSFGETHQPTGDLEMVDDPLGPVPGAHVASAPLDQGPAKQGAALPYGAGSLDGDHLEEDDLFAMTPDMTASDVLGIGDVEVAPVRHPVFTFTAGGGSPNSGGPAV
ncbi:hypothetical protein H696_04134 [Fonticula alba]|uniref:Transmembrane protein 184C n=1 Tax=Fonticula alba TaxID=691883 RepID=A0A058Z717_FONAL|nr:hypothetical protein H696_04134 [Fonticula alba]KCV69728.1 hypothetical protein H696_04134 [Fonticula alba]|eukprot:XP_009496293.1 hypothetical protein H696_04134 [Fonticula alba]